MIYKLIEKKDCVIEFDKNSGTYVNNYKKFYGTKRKGKIFGFWHEVGTESCDYQGNTYISEDWFDDKQKAISYARAFNEQHYGRNESFKILE